MRQLERTSVVERNDAGGRVWACLAGCAIICALLMTGGLGATTGLAQSSLKSADNLIRNAEADIRSAEGSAGTADRPAKGSRRKLTQMRLDSAKQRLAKAGPMLSTFSADHPSAGPLKKRYSTAMASIAKVEAILDPKSQVAGKKPAPDSSAGGKTPAAVPKGSSTPKLDYKQKKLLKDARWYLRETEKYCKPAAAVLGRMDGTGPKPVIGEVQGAVAVIERAIPKYNLAIKNIDQLPANHPDVAPVRAQILKTGQTLGAMRTRLNAENARLKKLTGSGSFPGYKRDYELLSDLSVRYGNFEMMTQQHEKLAQIIKEDGQSVKEFQRIARTYQPLVDQKTEAGKRMEKRVLYVISRRKAFAQKLMVYKQSLPKAIEADLAEALRLAKEGVEKKRPLYFGEHSGIQQRFGFAEKKLLVLQAFSEAEAKPHADKLAAIREQIKQSAKALETDIIAGNQLPLDRYQAKDRNALIKLATEAWAMEQKGAQVLAARIPSQAWSRNTRWKWSNGGFYKIDASNLQVQLVIKHDDKLAVIRPINLYSNHLKGDTLTAFPMDKSSYELSPQRYLLLTKLK